MLGEEIRERNFSRKVFSFGEKLLEGSFSPSPSSRTFTKEGFLWGKLFGKSSPHTPFKSFYKGGIKTKFMTFLRCSKQSLPQVF